MEWTRETQTSDAAAQLGVGGQTTLEKLPKRPDVVKGHGCQKQILRLSGQVLAKDADHGPQCGTL